MWLTWIRWAAAHRALLGAVGAAVLLGVLAWGLWAVRQAGYEAGRSAVQAAWDESVRQASERARADERSMQRTVDAVAARLSTDLADIRQKNGNLIREIEDEVQVVPVYGDCRLTDGVWRRLNELHAATGTGPTGGGGDPMPGPGADP